VKQFTYTQRYIREAARTELTREWENAARQGDADSLSAMLEAGSDPDARDSHGQTAIMLAAHRGHLDAVRVLINAKADLDRNAKFGLTATMLAVVSGHETIARLLAESGADLLARGSGAPGFANKTAADLARDQGLEELAAFLDPGSPAA
jgi:ankyrin repeat protein